MAPREPTRAQLSSKLSYQQTTPSFLLKLQNRMNGIPDEDDAETYNQGDDDEFEYTGEGRAPIPRRPRPAIPERPADDPGSADEDEEFADEKPQVVVLKAGKHLTEFEAENIRRAEKGLPPLLSPEEKAAAEKTASEEKSGREVSSSSSKSASQGLSFSSSSKPGTAGAKPNKRKAVGQLDELKAELKSKEKAPKTSSSKKAKKQSKTLLSFGDDT
ncbi:hypothetical protein JR316_0006292 [Psilocybe cubensis]|uniref:DUF4604 domain-containing protein n=2 Tax=Psilocybe cubensis TaxID=181762 RepID=A0A8H7XZC3_PSICU|nr:hypothetical protein JR316_0006292 [Psilocybe cubensis]KAH9481765.1 hypothetical protein JR316_0006292 [Psilocybe cubensis]